MVCPHLALLRQWKAWPQESGADLLPLIQAAAAQGAVVGERPLQGRDAAERADAQPPPRPREPALAVRPERPPAARAGGGGGAGAAPDRDADELRDGGRVEGFVGHGVFAPLPPRFLRLLPSLTSRALAFLASCSLASLLGCSCLGIGRCHCCVLGISR